MVKTPSDPLDLAFASTSRLDRVKTSLRLVEETRKRNPKSERHFNLRQELLVAAVIAATAEMENFLKKSLLYIYDKINKSLVSYKDLHIGLITMSLGSEFDNLNSRKWNRRHSFIERTESDDVFDMGNSVKNVPPLDGKTIREYHFEDIFSYLGINECIYFPDTSRIPMGVLNYEDQSEYITSFHVKNVIRTVADIRNELVHGDGDVYEIFNINRQDRSVMAIIYYIDIYINQIEYLGNIFYSYIEDRSYLK